MQGDHYYLVNNDTNSREFILSIFSCFKFHGDRNNKLFELKLINYDSSINDL